MLEDNDERLTRLLRQDAPPERDPVFRLRVLERRERKRFRNRILLLCAAALSLIAMSIVGLNLGGDFYAATRNVLIIAGIISVGIVYVPVAKRLLRRFH